jgi:hypothetical protein
MRIALLGCYGTYLLRMRWGKYHRGKPGIPPIQSPFFIGAAYEQKDLKEVVVPALRLHRDMYGNM